MDAGDQPDTDSHGGAPRSAAVHPFPKPGTPEGPRPGAARTPPPVSFDRHELREILNLYGRRVAEGEWRDYAISFSAQKAVFSIYRRTSEVPLYRIEKDPSLARRQGAYAVVTAAGLVLKRGPDLDRVLRVLDKKPKLVVV